MNGSGRSTFFEHGEVSISSHDEASRQASLFICLPCCLMHAATPILLGGGLIDKYEVHSPLAVWIPMIQNERLVPEAIEGAPHLPTRIMSAIVSSIKGSMELFSQLSKVLVDPSDPIPMLPLGTYVNFQYRCNTDKLADVITGLQSIVISGMSEFCFALAEILAQLLTSEGQTFQSLPVLPAPLL